MPGVVWVSDIATADLNGDGRLDLVLSGRGTVYRLLGNADECLGRACCVDGAVPMHPEPLHLEEDVLAVVAEELSREVQTHQVSVLPRLEGMPAGTVVAASRLGMKIVFRNLMRPAVKYGAAGCTIVCGYQDQRHHHRMNVYNSGTPIPPECQGRLFTKFGTLESHEIPYVLGMTWTTDAFYRETRGKVERRVAEGCLTVEMEAAALFAVARFRGVSLGQVLYAGDDLSGDVWDPRGWTRHTTGRDLLIRLAAESVLTMSASQPIE
jgi:hypothetical protein